MGGNARHFVRLRLPGLSSPKKYAGLLIGSTSISANTRLRPIIRATSGSHLDLSHSNISSSKKSGIVDTFSINYIVCGLYSQQVFLGELLRGRSS
jgi:hypothetical protein